MNRRSLSLVTSVALAAGGAAPTMDPSDEAFVERIPR
jgi:hypothetical protein